MNAPLERLPPSDLHTFVFASSSTSHIGWLADALASHGRVESVTPQASTLHERIAMLTPVAAFLDFSGSQGEAAAQLHERLKRDWPGLPVLAVGRAGEAATVLAALRAGVDDFVDVLAPPADAVRTLSALLDRLDAADSGRHGCTVALLGARPGLGVTTLATSLALTLHALRLGAAQPGAAAIARGARQGVALLDLGWPARDGLLFLDTQSTFSFADGIRNLRRLDKSLLATALAHHGSGLAVMPLPAGGGAGPMRDVSATQAMALITRLADFFDFQVADLGGLPGVDLVAESARAADQVWVVCDQSLGGIVSTASLLAELRLRGLDTTRLSLVVNRFDPQVGLSANDVAQRLELPLRHVLPMRSTALLAAGSRGEMLVRSAPRDPYSQAVSTLAQRVLQEFSGGAAAATAVPASRWARWFGRATPGGSQASES